MARASFPATKPSAVSLFARGSFVEMSPELTRRRSSLRCASLCQVCSAGPGSSCLHLFPFMGLCGADVSLMPSFAKFPAGVHGALSAPVEPSRASRAVAVLLHSHIMSEARHWPAFRLPIPCFSSAPPIVVLNSSPVAFPCLGVRACQHRFSRQFLYLCCAARRLRRPAPRVALGAQAARAQLRGVCRVHLVPRPVRHGSFSACQSASLQRATLPAAPSLQALPRPLRAWRGTAPRSLLLSVPLSRPAPPQRACRAPRKAATRRREAGAACFLFTCLLCPVPPRRSFPAARPLLPTRASMRPRHASFLQREGPRAALIRAATTARRMSLQPWRAPLASDAPSAAVERGAAAACRVPCARFAQTLRRQTLGRTACGGKIHKQRRLDGHARGRLRRTRAKRAQACTARRKRQRLGRMWRRTGTRA
ncbi:hypothetical protein ERJ75_000685700 [Trypanosoma vivax]|nr:hypothetical protein ERJ75_000685700 [Trypanosoma vivax]